MTTSCEPAACEWPGGGLALGGPRWPDRIKATAVLMWPRSTFLDTTCTRDTGIETTAQQCEPSTEHATAINGTQSEERTGKQRAGTTGTCRTATVEHKQPTSNRTGSS